MFLGKLKAIALFAILTCFKTFIQAEKQFSVVGYLPEWRYEGANFDYMLKTVTHLILFSLEPTPKGEISSLDRIPRAPILKNAMLAAKEYNSKVLICFGGNGRSGGFSQMVRSSKARTRFVQNLIELIKTYGFDGVDYNWEYPGYSFGSGYHNDRDVEKDYKGLARLVKETKSALKKMGTGGVITLAYYPDGRQERLLIEYGISEDVDLLNVMSYDQGGREGHSTLDFGLKCLQQAIQSGLPPNKVMLGLPFYGRVVGQGEWESYEDILQLYPSKDLEQDMIAIDSRNMLSFNSIGTIKKKTEYVLQHAAGGVMIWEVGQDCRVKPVVHEDGSSHQMTCSQESDSLLHAISTVINQYTPRGDENHHEEF